MNKSKKNLKMQKGITLVALVITIIVLLILAGVSISLVVGNNGVLTQASNAVVSNREAVAREEVAMAVASAETEYWTEWAKDSSKSKDTYFIAINLTKYTGGTSGTGTVTESIFLDDGSCFVIYKSNDQETTYVFSVDINGNVSKALAVAEKGRDIVIGAGETAVDGNKIYKNTDENDDDKIIGIAIIPKGWTVSGFSDEQTIANGLVIYDLEGASVTWNDTDKETNQTGYNQFVWVPVNNLSLTATSMSRYDGYGNESRQTLVNVDIPACKEPYPNGYSTEFLEYMNMVNSVKSNSGFYVGRYEASSSDGTANGTAESKKEKDPWVNIIWGESMNNIGTDGAVAKAKAMYSIESNSVTSTLIYGAQWDAIMTWIDSNYTTSSGCSSNSFVVNSTNKGNYSGSIAKTGSNTDYAVNNIYDMAGNVWEMNMEAFNNAGRVTRGCCFYDNGLNFPVSRRSQVNPNSSAINVGFRVTLYL